MSSESLPQHHPMISYAQNFEDVILERIFRSVEQGFYVDIGACHPVHDSVTQHFYLRGWRGINVEPQSVLFAEFERARPRDINLNICVGRTAGRKTLFITSDRGTSTLDEHLAERYQNSGRVVNEQEVSVLPLNELWLHHVGQRWVDFLKIDVEGFEEEILAATDFVLVRPRLLLIEAVQPESHVPSHEAWEHLVLPYYNLLYRDGLNRFYIRKGDPLDSQQFCAPPNVFDTFVGYREHLAAEASRHLNEQVRAQQEQLGAYEKLLAEKDAALHDAAHAYSHLRQELDTGLARKDTALAEAADAYSALLREYDALLALHQRISHADNRP